MAAAGQAGAAWPRRASRRQGRPAAASSPQATRAGSGWQATPPSPGLACSAAANCPSAIHDGAEGEPRRAPGWAGAPHHHQLPCPDAPLYPPRCCCGGCCCSQGGFCSPEAQAGQRVGRPGRCRCCCCCCSAAVAVGDRKKKSRRPGLGLAVPPYQAAAALLAVAAARFLVRHRRRRRRLRGGGGGKERGGARGSGRRRRGKHARDGCGCCCCC